MVAELVSQPAHSVLSRHPMPHRTASDNTSTRSRTQKTQKSVCPSPPFSFPSSTPPFPPSHSLHPTRRTWHAWLTLPPLHPREDRRRPRRREPLHQARDRASQRPAAAAYPGRSPSPIGRHTAFRAYTYPVRRERQCALRLFVLCVLFDTGDADPGEGNEQDARAGRVPEKARRGRCLE